MEKPEKNLLPPEAFNSPALYDTIVDSDLVDPSVWEKLTELLDKLPEDRTPDPDDPPPLI